MAITDSTSASSGEHSSRALDLTDEINKKLKQARGICNVICLDEGIDRPIADSVWAASDLIEEAEKAFDELSRLNCGKGVFRQRTITSARQL